MLKEKIAERIITLLEEAEEEDFYPIDEVVDLMYWDDFVLGVEEGKLLCEKYVEDNINHVILTIMDFFENREDYYDVDLKNRESLARITTFRLAKEIWNDLEVLEEVTGTSDKKYETMVIEELKKTYNL